MATGAVTLSVYLTLAVLLGVYRIDTSGVTPYRGCKAVFAAMTSCPLAIVEQIIFSGYLLSILRGSYSRVTAVLVPALLFGLIAQLQNSQELTSTPSQLLVVGIFFAAVLLGLLRLACGSILLPAGLLAGWLMVGRVVSKTKLLLWQPHEPWSSWLAPYADPRRSPVMWLVLGLGILGVSLYLLRRGEGSVPNLAPALDRNFKRWFPLSNSSILAPLDVWFPELLRARFRVGVIYLPRLLAGFIISTANTLLTLPERVIVPLIIRRRQLRDPVFVVGTHRSGTTHLHNLLALDAQFRTPRAFHTMNPHGCVFSGWLVTPLLGAFMPWSRPMDSVRFHIFSPQEDEFGVLGMGGQSPLWGMTFPKQWQRYDRYIFPDRLSQKEKRKWKRNYLGFLKRVFIWSSKRPLLKNPYNTARVGILQEMFPNASFVHICRHPYTVYGSNRHMAREGHVLTQLQDPDADNSYDENFIGNYRAMEDAFQTESQRLASDQVAKIRFEELERDPVSVIRSIYKQLNLQFTTRYEHALNNYLETISDYRKNRHPE
ncbi:MAG: sulfotransferase, partial [Planctomycetales bacterium]